MFIPKVAIYFTGTMKRKALGNVKDKRNFLCAWLFKNICKTAVDAPGFMFIPKVVIHH